MRSPIAFSAEDGTTLRGWHYVPDQSKKYYPTVVFAHGFTALKEHYLDDFADAFAKAGFASIVFDNRGFGESDGLPRQHIDPWKQISDYRDAITYAETSPETDARRIAVWGTSYSGGHAMVVAAIDRRVKCVVAQVPLTSGHANIRCMLRGDFLSALQRQCEDDRRSRKAGKLRKMIAAITNDPDIPAAMPTADTFDFFSGTQERAPRWKSEVTLQSVEMSMEYEPGIYARLISPTPFLMLAAYDDILTPYDLAVQVYEDALPPKKLVMRPGGHFDAYVADFAAASSAAIDWFTEHLHAD
jgi:uncharacterized protein